MADEVFAVCGEDFCAECGDCLACYGSDPCYGGVPHASPEGGWFMEREQ